MPDIEVIAPIIADLVGIMGIARYGEGYAERTIINAPKSSRPDSNSMSGQSLTLPFNSSASPANDAATVPNAHTANAKECMALTSF